jgi:integral membrane protein (TIGR01906 family)
MKPTILRTILLSLITVLVPVALVLGVVRIILSPWYPSFEYHTPNFPADEFGFTLQDRLHYARFAVDYLITNADISLLMNLHFPNDQVVPPFSCAETDDCTRVFNDRELQHMIDVKYVLGFVLPVGYAAWVVLIGLGLWAWRGKWWIDYRRAVSRGGWVMVGLLVAIVVLVAGFFDWFFTAFHNTFFSKGTWQFFYSDTLIRLFPERFWMNTFVFVGGLAGLTGLALGYFLRVKPVNTYEAGPTQNVV